MILGQREKQQKAIEEQRKWQLTVTNDKKKMISIFMKMGKKITKFIMKELKKYKF